MPQLGMSESDSTGCRRDFERRWCSVALACLYWAAPAGAASAPVPTPPAGGAQLFQQACAACHGVDGKGAPRALVGFHLPLPDFTDCNAYTREPNTDWLAVILPGRTGPRLRPDDALVSEALTLEQVDALVAHLRTFCRDESWPRGELNLPRAMFTEKAYPEDEAVITSGVTLEGAGDHQRARLREAVRRVDAD